MLTNTVPQMDMSDNPQGYCPRFNPEGWDGRHLHFEDKLFVHATTRSVMHVPVNMGRVFTRVQGHIEDAVVQDPCGYFVLSRDLSATKGEHLFAVTGPIPEEEMTTLTGDYVTRVFEGPYRKAKDWVHEMEVAVKSREHMPGDVFMFYTTCPKCARAYGKNYVVGVSEVRKSETEI